MESNNEKVIELLEEIKGVLEEIRDNKEDDSGEVYTCDQCEEEVKGEPEEQVNKFTFCSSNCYNNWKDDYNN